MRRILSPLIVSSLALLFTDASFAQPASSAWPMFRHDPRHTGRSEYGGPIAARLAWSYSVDGPIWSSSPALGTDGRSYVGTTERRVYALESSGALAWSYDVGEEADVSPAVGADGGVYTASLTSIHKFGSAGTLAWSYEVLSMKYSSPVLDSGGRMYVGSQDNNLYAFGSVGAIAWSYRTGWDIQSSPALGSNEKLYVGSIPADLRVYCVNPNGTLAWSHMTGGGITSSPALSEDGRVYIGSGDNNMYALNSYGGVAWSYATHGPINYSSPALGSDGTVHIGAAVSDTRLYAVAAAGNLRWSYATSGGIESSPAVGADGAVYVGSLDGHVYGFASTGQLLWTYQTAGLRASSPAIGSNGRVYMGTTGNSVLVFHGPTPYATPTITPTPGITPTPTETPTEEEWYAAYGPDGSGDVVQIGALYVASRKTGQGCAWGATKNWLDALGWADALDWLGRADWRLPTGPELSMICISKDQLASYEETYYWSSIMKSESRAWIVSFWECIPNNDDITWNYYMRAVRSAPPPSEPLSLIISNTTPSTHELLTIAAEVKVPVNQVFDAYGVILAPDGYWYSMDPVDPWSVAPGLHPMFKNVMGVMRDTTATLLSMTLPPGIEGPCKVIVGLVPAGEPARMENAMKDSRGRLLLIAKNLLALPPIPCPEWLPDDFTCPPFNPENTKGPQ